jgi:F0F1-type ATP synthase delta subunit
MKITSTQYAKALVALSKDGGDASQIAASFLSFVKKHRGEKKLPEIVRAAEKLSDEAAGRVTLLAETAGEVDADSKKEIALAAGKLFPGEEVSLGFAVRRDLVGGVRLSSRDVVVDGTIGRRIRELRGAMNGHRSS